MTLNERDAYFTRVLDDGRVLDVVPLACQRARIVISRSLDAMDWTDDW